MAERSSNDLNHFFPGDTEVARLMRQFDWLTTSLGAPETWPQSLQTTVRIMLTSRFAMWMAWGPERQFFYNEAYRPTLGLKHPGSIGRRAHEVWAEIWPEIGPLVDQVFETGLATWNEGLFLVLERSGFAEETYHTFSYSPAPNDDGSIGGMLCVVSEETERVISQRRIAFLGHLGSGLSVSFDETGLFSALEASLQTCTQDLPFLLCFLYDFEGATARLVSSHGIDPDAPIAPKLLDLTGDPLIWPADEIYEHPKLILVENSDQEWPCGPWDIPPTVAAIVPIAQQGFDRPAGFIVTGLNPYRVFDANYTGFLELLAGQIASALANIRSYEAEKRRAEELAKLDRAKTAFFSNVSHELRTPLTLILGTLDQILTRESDVLPTVRQDLEMAERNSLRLLKLVNTLLEFSRIEAGRIQSTFEPTDLTSITADLASNFRSAADRANINLQVVASPLSQPVYLDVDLWEKVVLNLLSNALKHTFAGEIVVRLTETPEVAVLTVEDTGTGIPAEDQVRLFERFYRVEGAAGRTHEGTGIGLALVQEIVKLHGGKVEVESELGQGSRFIVTIPFGNTHLPPDRVVTHSTGHSRSRHARAFVEEALRWLPDTEISEVNEKKQVSMDDGHTTVGARVLVADDNADLRQYLFRLLNDSYAVEVVSDGNHALEAARRDRPELIISDVMMPRLDGFGLLTAVRNDPQLYDVPVIMLSARAGEEAQVEGLSQGADDYLVKPFTASELLARVALHIRLAREDRAAREAKEKLLRELNAERSKLSAIFEQAPAFMATMVGRDFVFEYINEAYQKIIGNRKALGKPILEVIPEADEQGFITLLEQVLDTGEPFIGQELPWRISLDGISEPQTFYFDFVYQPMRDSEGEITGVMAHGVDVTTQVLARTKVEGLNMELEERVAERTSELERAYRELETFSYTVAHDLRAPLRSVVATSEILMEDLAEELPSEATTLLRRQSSEARRLATLIDQLLAFAKVSRQDVLKEDVDMSALAEEVANRTETMGGPMEIAIQPGMRAKGDPRLLELVWMNLIHNAQKFSPDGGLIRVGCDDGTFFVRDQGVGFDMAMSHKLFQPFERLVGAAEFPGTGIGLANVRRIVERHQGRIWAESQLGHGATFFFTLG